jgi:hypothetical protein
VAIARAFRAAGVGRRCTCRRGRRRAREAGVRALFQTPLSDRIRNEAGVPTIAVGNVTEWDQVNAILAAGRADLVALARPHLATRTGRCTRRRRRGTRAVVAGAVPVGAAAAGARARARAGAARDGGHLMTTRREAPPRGALAGRHAVVTGASRGIGAAVAEALARDGAR